MPSAENYHLQINQAAEGLRALFEAQLRNNTQNQRHVDKLNARIHELEAQLEGPPEGLKVWGDRTGYSKRIVDLETRVAELETTERRLREYMRLKDIAKMKVERDRDLYLRQRNRAEDRITALHDKAAENAELKSMNTRQAEAFKDKEAQCVKQQSKIRELQGRLDNVMQIMQNAVDGTRSSNPYGEWRPWPEAIPRPTWIDGRDVQGR